ncbi:hypothetical protein [Xanthomonas cassavae]|nr:hypothetical protein [Xanthomonas cassavae]
MRKHAYLSTCFSCSDAAFEHVKRSGDRGFAGADQLNVKKSIEDRALTALVSTANLATSTVKPGQASQPMITARIAASLSWYHC